MLNTWYLLRKLNSDESFMLIDDLFGRQSEYYDSLKKIACLKFI
jgi:hypothetical protein